MTTIVIDEKTETGKSLMNIIKALQKTSEAISIFSDKDADDFFMGKLIQQRETKKYVSRDEIMSILES